MKCLFSIKEWWVSQNISWKTPWKVLESSWNFIARYKWSPLLRYKVIIDFRQSKILSTSPSHLQKNLSQFIPLNKQIKSSQMAININILLMVAKVYKILAALVFLQFIIYKISNTCLWLKRAYSQSLVTSHFY